jgi:hypothetical protein
MKKTIVALAAVITLSAPALARAPGPVHHGVSSSGVSFTYRVVDRGSWRDIIGEDSDGREFRLRVSGSRVTGEYGMQRISWRLPAAAPATRRANTD